MKGANERWSKKRFENRVGPIRSSVDEQLTIFGAGVVGQTCSLAPDFPLFWHYAWNARTASEA